MSYGDNISLPVLLCLLEQFKGGGGGGGGGESGGLHWRGTVNYAADLPGTASEGDCYTVLYQGTSGTVEDGSVHAYVTDGVTPRWIILGGSSTDSGALHWRGYVNYVADLPVSPAEGDVYTVRYKGTSGTVADGSARAYVKNGSTYLWLTLGGGSGISYKGSVNYFSDLPVSSEENDAYTVRYKGTTGSVTDGDTYLCTDDGNGGLTWVSISGSGDLQYRGTVSYAADLPVSPEEGDVYAVLYQGTTGTVPDNGLRAYVKQNGTLTWISLSKPGGLHWRGTVNYAADLPVSPDEGDVYRVLYKGTMGTVADNSIRAYVYDGSGYTWVTIEETGYLRWKGIVSYYADLPVNPDEGDAYTVQYIGSSGSIPDGSIYTYVYDGSAYRWILLHGTGHLHWKGYVNYYSGLPLDAAEGDAYTVRYIGSTGSIENGAVYAYVRSGSTLQWVCMYGQGYFRWRGEVSYATNLPTTAVEGDVYRVKYTGTTGTEADGTLYVYNTTGANPEWVPLSVAEEPTFNWLGTVSYYSDLPAAAEEGDAYTILYRGTTGTLPDQRIYVRTLNTSTQQLEWTEVTGTGAAASVRILSQANYASGAPATALTGDAYIINYRGSSGYVPDGRLYIRLSDGTVVPVGDRAGGFHWMGVVNYQSDLPVSPAEGDVYYVNYSGTTGIAPLGKYFVFVRTGESTYYWQKLVEDGCLHWRGDVNYYSDLSSLNASEGDVYRVLYTGTSGTVTDGSAWAYMYVQGAHIWIRLSQPHIDAMTGATASAAGATGLVPAPASGENLKFLRGDGTWKDGSAKKSVALSATWSGTGPYTQTVTISGYTITANSKVDLQPDVVAINVLANAGTVALYIINNNGTLTAYALGNVPAIALTIQCTITEVETI